MDPDACLREIRDIVQLAGAAELDWEEAFERLAERVGGLDDWLSRGGFPPAAWRSDS
jgi:hypothetical protein